MLWKAVWVDIGVVRAVFVRGNTWRGWPTRMGAGRTATLARGWGEAEIVVLSTAHKTRAKSPSTQQHTLRAVDSMISRGVDVPASEVCGLNERQEWTGGNGPHPLTWRRGGGRGGVLTGPIGDCRICGTHSSHIVRGVKNGKQAHAVGWGGRQGRSDGTVVCDGDA